MRPISRILTVLLTVLAVPAVAAESVDLRVRTLERDVKAVWNSLQKMSEDFTPKDGDVDQTLWHAARGEMAWHTGDSLVAAVHLLKAVRQKGFSDHQAYPTAMYFLAEALYGLHISGLARQMLDRALAYGPRNRHFKSMLAKYLEVAWDDHDPGQVDRWVSHYRERWMGRPKQDEADSAIRYRYGKVLLHRGQPAMARAVLQGVGEDDEHHLRAQYLIGVALVVEEDLKGAALFFEATARRARTAAAAFRRKRLEETRELMEEEDTRLEVTSHKLAADPIAGAARAMERVHDPAHDKAPEASRAEWIAAEVARQAALSRARLAMVAEEFETAWRWYRWVPPGTPEHREALEEGVWCLLRREEFARAERRTEHLIGMSDPGLSQGFARVLRAHLMAQSGDFAGAESHFLGAMRHFQSQLPILEAAGEGLSVAEDGSVAFHPKVVAWTPAVDLSAAVGRVGRLNDRLAEVAAANGLMDALQQVVDDPSRMPIVQEAHARGEALRERISYMRAEVNTVRSIAVGPQSRGIGSKLPGSAGGVAGAQAILQRLRVVEQWMGSLEQHLQAHLSAVERSAGEQAREVALALDQERQRVLGYDHEVHALHEESVRAAKVLAAGAQARVADLFLRAELGLTGVSYERKDSITRRIDFLYAEQKHRQKEWQQTRRQADMAQVPDVRAVNYPPGLEGSSTHSASPDDK